MKVLIAGGVAGGAGTAARLRRNDENAQIILLERGGFISFANCGLPYYLGGVIEDREELLLQTPESFRARFAVEVRTHSEVTAVDPVAKAVTVRDRETGRVYRESYDKLVLSPGARPVQPPIPGADRPEVFTLRNVEDTLRIAAYLDTRRPKNCAIVGGGSIGLEMAENLRRRGIGVSLIEASDHVMATLDADMAHGLHRVIRSHGVRLELGARVTEIGTGSVTLADGRHIAADMVLLSAGVRPDTDFLKDSGIRLGLRGGILVNEYMETSAPDVYALGDAAVVKDLVTGQDALVSLASPANRQARIVADNMAGGRVAYRGAQGTAIAKVFDHTAAMTGQSEAALLRAGTPYRKSYTWSASHAGYYPGGSMMAVKLLYTPREGRLLGAQIVGADGVDKRIDTLAGVLRRRGTVYDLQELELAYAPPYSSAKDPVNMAGYVAENVLTGKSRVFYAEDVAALPAGIQLIDVRTPGEFARGTIGGAANLPLDDIRANFDRLDPQKPVYVFCQIGLRGYLAEQILRAHGFDVKNLSGGYRLYDEMRQDKTERAV